MLIRNGLRRGEGKLNSFDLEVGHAHRRRNMADEEARYEEEFNFKSFYIMAENVGQFLSRIEKVEGKKA